MIYILVTYMYNLDICLQPLFVQRKLWRLDGPCWQYSDGMWPWRLGNRGTVVFPAAKTGGSDVFHFGI